LTGEIREFPKRPKPRPPEPSPQPAQPALHNESIESLTTMLELAKEGKIHGFAAVWSDLEGTIRQCIEPSDVYDGHMMVGSIILLMHDISDQLRADAIS
jgi:hypothetical protein